MAGVVRLIAHEKALEPPAPKGQQEGYDNPTEAEEQIRAQQLERLVFLSALRVVAAISLQTRVRRS